MGWYIISGSIVLLVVIIVSVMIIRELYFINKDYKKDMDYYNSSDKNYKLWNNKPQKRNIENASSYVLFLAVSVAPLFVIAILQIIIYYGNTELAETYKYLSQYETYDFGSDYDSLAIKNDVLLKFNDYNGSLARAKTNVNKFPFWTFDNKEIINNLDYLMFK